jgi:ElaB/YqjD/DUF883 family membrane-anchored ribosome-binding protein
MSDENLNKQHAELQLELQALIIDTEKLLHHAASLAGEHADELREQIKTSLERAKTALNNHSGEIREQSAAIRQASEAFVQSNPWPAVGIAAGLGLILGLLIGRR